MITRKTKIKLSAETNSLEKEVTVYTILFIPVFKSTREVVKTL